MFWSINFEEMQLKQRTYQVKYMKKGSNPTFIHRANVILHPFSQNQIQLQESPLFTSIQKPKFQPKNQSIITNQIQQEKKTNKNPLNQQNGQTCWTIASCFLHRRDRFLLIGCSHSKKRNARRNLIRVCITPKSKHIIISILIEENNNEWSILETRGGLRRRWTCEGRGRRRRMFDWSWEDVGQWGLVLFLNLPFS